MKTIKDLTVKVTYRVGLGNIEVRDEIYEALDYLADRGETGCDLVDVDEKVGTAFEWLADHIHERDAFDWDYEVDIE